MDKKLQCKVKIGCNYEPKWFERRQTSGWYSGKNPPLDQDAMSLQSALLGSKIPTRKRTTSTLVAGVILLAVWVVGITFP